ncbi:Hypothetical protein DHA2_152676 [Giardia duodenalis]|uniref:Uncharacterized protein n=1 Tax=Giardia intestinalis TaxID=5741 RepID=V6TG28_GIAIN|nr:Hypothetical protein DHA2_152676 [Giardia intestinalis]
MRKSRNWTALMEAAHNNNNNNSELVESWPRTKANRRTQADG